MSINYASGLSEYPDKGVCGLPEKFDPDFEVEEKCLTLATWIKEANGLVTVHTGAGISTASGIPDFRGPRGVWTLEQRNEKPSFNSSFDHAKPTLTHMALVALEDAGFINTVVTQNVDGLHLRSGFPRNRLAILHGDMFLEECELCHNLYQRTTQVTTVGLKRSGRRCNASKLSGRGRCRGFLRDTILDWEDELPAEDLYYAQDSSEKAFLSLCLGTSLRIEPGGNLPLITKKRRKNKKDPKSTLPSEFSTGRVAIVNLQATKRDRDADLKIHAYVDNVMERVCKYLNVVIPDFIYPKIVLQSRHTLPDEIPVRTLVLAEKLENSGENLEDASKKLTNGCFKLLGKSSEKLKNSPKFGNFSVKLETSPDKFEHSPETSECFSVKLDNSLEKLENSSTKLETSSGMSDISCVKLLNLASKLENSSEKVENLHKELEGSPETLKNLPQTLEDSSRNLAFKRRIVENYDEEVTLNNEPKSIKLMEYEPPVIDLTESHAVVTEVTESDVMTTVCPFVSDNLQNCVNDVEDDIRITDTELSR